MAALETELPRATVTGRDRILREARSLFTGQGYAAVSMQQIADAASVNKATLYHHFRYKEDLLVSVMAEDFSRMAGVVAEAIAEGESLREHLARVAGHVPVRFRTVGGRHARLRSRAAAFRVDGALSTPLGADT